MSTPRPGHAAEPAGSRFQGASIPAQSFSDDDGSAPPQVRDALESRDVAQLVAALRGQRLLVALVAALDSTTSQGQEKDSHMAAAMWQRPDGQKALLAFSSAAVLTQWDPAARPLPVPAAQVAQAAIEDGASAVLVDRQVALSGPALWAVAQNRDLLSPAEDVEVAQRVAALVAEVMSGTEVPTRHRLVADSAYGLTVVLDAVAATRRDLVERLAQVLAEDSMLRTRTSAMNLAVLPTTPTSGADRA